MKDYKRLTIRYKHTGEIDVDCSRCEFAPPNCKVGQCMERLLQRLGELEDMIEEKELVYVGKWCDCTKCKNNEICYIYQQSGGGDVKKQNCSHFVAKEEL